MLCNCALFLRFFLKSTCLFLFVSFSFFIHAQVAPGIEWRKCTWSPNGLNGQPQQQSQSGEEWWYSHKNLYDATGTPTAFVTVGYTSLVSTLATYSNAELYYNEGPDSPFNPVNPVTYDYNALPEGCSDRDYLGEHRTIPRGNIGLNSLNGDMIFCKPKTVGALEEVVQDMQNREYVYVVGTHLGVKPYRNKTDFIPYNPTANSPTDYFSMSNLGVSNYTNSVDHFYVAKIKIDGTIMWQGLYAAVDFLNSPLKAYECKSYGYDIMIASNGNLVAVGLSRADDSRKKTFHPFVVEIDKNTGYLLNKTILPVESNSITSAVPFDVRTSFSGEAHSVAEIGNSGKYVVATNYYFKDTYAVAKDDNNAFVWCLDKNLNVEPSWAVNPKRFALNDTLKYNSNLWELKYHNSLQQILVPVVQNCYKCGAAGRNAGEGYIYRLDSLGNLVNNGTNPSLMGPINAFDLRIGVEETYDGGYVAVSSTRPPSSDHTPPTQNELGYLANCGDLQYLDFDDWDTEALIVKFSPDGKTSWSKAFDVSEGRKRQPPPADLKRQECMYKITQVPDGGYVISGNASGNFDDNYMAKLYNECNGQQTYTYGPNYEINITSNVTWNSSINVLGKIVIHPGVVFTIDGPTTVIRFADSKLTGIPTNITVMQGGLLNLTNGARVASLDTALCSNSKWDGVINLQDIAEDGQLVVFPNPASTVYSILYNGDDAEDVTFTVTDMLGNILRSGTLRSDLMITESCATYSAGVYFVSLYKGKSFLKSKKIIVLKQ